MEGEFNFDELFTNHSKIEIIPLVKNNYSQFDIGDRVKVTDYVSMSDGNTYHRVKKSEINSLKDIKYFIVIDIKQDSIILSRGSRYLQDIVVVNPTNNKIYRVSSLHICIYEMKE